MGISYDKLWKKLIDKKMKKMDLKSATGMGSTTLSKLSKDEIVSMNVLVKICDVLDCDFNDIVEYKKD